MGTNGAKRQSRNKKQSFRYSMTCIARTEVAKKKKRTRTRPSDRDGKRKSQTKSLRTLQKKQKGDQWKDNDFTIRKTVTSLETNETNRK